MMGNRWKKLVKCFICKKEVMKKDTDLVTQTGKQVRICKRHNKKDGER